MKTLLTILPFFISTLISSQTQTLEIAAQLQRLYAQNALYPDNSLSYDPASKIMVLSGYHIHVTSDTHVKAEKDKTDKTQRNRINFYCQNYTYITHKDRPEERHAQLSVPMKTRKACKKFTKLFAKLE